MGFAVGYSKKLLKFAKTKFIFAALGAAAPLPRDPGQLRFCDEFRGVSGLWVSLISLSLYSITCLIFFRLGFGALVPWRGSFFCFELVIIEVPSLHVPFFHLLRRGCILFYRNVVVDGQRCMWCDWIVSTKLI